MRVDYTNYTITDTHARVTFIGYDPATGRRRRPVVEFDAHDMARLIAIVKEFAQRQRCVARRHTSNVETITQAGVAL